MLAFSSYREGQERLGDLTHGHDTIWETKDLNLPLSFLLLGVGAIGVSCHFHKQEDFGFLEPRIYFGETVYPSTHCLWLDCLPTM